MNAQKFPGWLGGCLHLLPRGYSCQRPWATRTLGAGCRRQMGVEDEACARRISGGHSSHGMWHGNRVDKGCRNALTIIPIAQCPPNTTPDLSADATSSCDTAGSVDLNMGAETSSGSAAVTQGCVGTGSCRIVCKFESPCMYGVESIHPTEGIRCAGLPAACGNRV